MQHNSTNQSAQEETNMLKHELESNCSALLLAVAGEENADQQKHVENIISIVSHFKIWLNVLVVLIFCGIYTTITKCFVRIPEKKTY